MNYDQLKFDMPPFSILFYATSIVCLRRDSGLSGKPIWRASTTAMKKVKATSPPALSKGEGAKPDPAEPDGDEEVVKNIVKLAKGKWDLLDLHAQLANLYTHKHEE